MKNSITFTLCLFLVFISATIVWAVASGNFSGTFGYTGAPTDGDCSSCHSVGAVISGGSISFSPTLSSNEYMPDSVYTVTVSIPRIIASRNGFMVTVQDGSTNNAGTLAITDATNTQLLTKQRLYVAHTSAGNSLSSWSFSWTAPSTGTGIINFYLAGIDANGSGTGGDAVYKTMAELIEFTVDVEDDRRAALARSFNLEQNYPNPFNPSTTINYSLELRSHVTLTVYNVVGQEVVTLVDGDYSAGERTASWDSTDKFGNQVASGIYFYSLKVNDFVKTKKMVLLQ